MSWAILLRVRSSSVSGTPRKIPLSPQRISPSWLLASIGYCATITRDTFKSLRLVIRLTISSASALEMFTLLSIMRLTTPCPSSTSTAIFGFSSFLYARSTIALQFCLQPCPDAKDLLFQSLFLLLNVILFVHVTFYRIVTNTF